MIGTSEVEDDEVELVLLELLHGALTVTHAHDRVLLALEVSSDRVTNRLLVLDEKNPARVLRHVVLLASPGASPLARPCVQAGLSPSIVVG